MNAPSPVPLTATPPAEQLRYAAWLEATGRGGLALLVVGYFAYVTGLLAPLVPLDTLPGLWNQSASDFMAQTGSPQGWGWLPLLAKGDILNLLGIAVLAGGSIGCLLAVMPLYARQGARVYVVVCGLQILVLMAAASGLLTAGH